MMQPLQKLLNKSAIGLANMAVNWCTEVDEMA